MHQMVQFLQCILTPVFYVVRPFSVWSFSFVLLLHYSELLCLKLHPFWRHLKTGSFYLLLIALCRIVSFLSTQPNIVSFVIFCVHFTLMILLQNLGKLFTCEEGNGKPPHSSHPQVA